MERKGFIIIVLTARIQPSIELFYSGDIIAAQALISPFHAFDAALRKDMFDGKLSATFR
jgi:hypothetical protein